MAVTDLVKAEQTVIFEEKEYVLGGGSAHLINLTLAEGFLASEVSLTIKPKGEALAVSISLSKFMAEATLL